MYDQATASQTTTTEVISTRERGGIYDLPVVGRPARRVRNFYDGMQPCAEDSPGVVVGKQVLRYSTVAFATVAGASIAAVAVL